MVPSTTKGRSPRTGWMERLEKVKHLTSRWWRKVSNFMRKANIHRLFSRKEEVVVIQVRPFFISGQRDAFPHDSFAPFVREGKVLCDPFHDCEWLACQF